MNNMILLASGDEQVRSRWSESLAEYRQVAQVDNHMRLNLFISQRPPAIVLLHLTLPGMKGLTDVETLKRNFPDSLILVMADVPFEQEGMASLRVGASGYANTYMSSRMLQKAVEVVLMGEVWVGRRMMQQVLTQWRQKTEPSPLELLTDRERQVALLVAEGLPNKRIADQLGVKERTVKAHLTAIFRKTGFKDRTSLAIRINQQPADKQPVDD
ncbi:MAG: DNA-binding response regulator [Gammaproteobacteria bacterium]